MRISYFLFRERGIAQKLSLLALMAVVILAGSPVCAAKVKQTTQTASEDLYTGVKQKLITDGFSREQVSELFHPAPAPIYKLVASTLRIREGQPPNYDHFLAPERIAAARSFIDSHQATFERARLIYGVEPGIIAAILLVETNFGSYTGKTQVLPVFATFAIMESKQNRDHIWKMLAPRDREKWGREAFDRKLLDRSAWAYKELEALLKLADTHGVKASSFRGSVMGAFGLPQFLPSSMVKFGADGNGDGLIDLFNPDDAIFSAANYLRGYGWCDAKFPSDKEQVIWQYNHSKVYVRIVLGIADMLVQQ